MMIVHMYIHILLLTVLVKRSLMHMSSKNGLHTSLSVKCFSWPESLPECTVCHIHKHTHTHEYTQL